RAAQRDHALAVAGDSRRSERRGEPPVCRLRLRGDQLSRAARGVHRRRPAQRGERPVTGGELHRRDLRRGAAMRRRAQRGYTLIELGIVLGVMAVFLTGVAATATGVTRAARAERTGRELAELSRAAAD